MFHNQSGVRSQESGGRRQEAFSYQLSESEFFRLGYYLKIHLADRRSLTTFFPSPHPHLRPLL
ncbi:hypothetical protein V0288_06430 [Pannus brasiliensis CCIBt3594]|uniref:Maturase K n=1 Tax=Pannus brasiliensis CCIBt3594 TaxID=1427578 RepID=A0AAW9QPU9_9CHRO